MKIKVRNLIKHIGSIIIINGADIPDGTYLIVDVNNNMVELYNIKNTELQESFLSNIEEVVSFEADDSTSLELMEEALIKQILILSNKGWGLISDNPELNPDMDLTEHISKLNIVRIVNKTIRLNKDDK